jgi:hypothetical protein
MNEITLPSSDGSDYLKLVNFKPDRNGVSFEIIISSRNFTGQTVYALEAVEFRSLLEDLQYMYDKLSGSADLRLHMEEDHVRFEINSSGQILVSGLLIHHMEPSHRLKFGFYSDQSCLPSFIQALSIVGSEIGKWAL